MKKILFLSILFCSLIKVSLAQSYSEFFGISGQDSVNFVFTVKVPDIKVLDSYPQRITEISKVGDNYKIALTNINPYADGKRFEEMKNARYDKSRVYDRDVAKYLSSTPLIDAENKHVQQIADTLFSDETKTFDIIYKGMLFVHGFLTPSDSIAKLIDAGVCRTLDVNTVIEIGKGTCSEYTNLFAALMRRMNIPTRFAVGYWNVPEWNSESSHAWPECYIEGTGWCAVDPTFPTPVYPHFAVIRMRCGLDFEDCDIETLSSDIDPLEFQKIK